VPCGKAITTESLALQGGEEVRVATGFLVIPDTSETLLRGTTRALKSYFLFSSKNFSYLLGLPLVLGGSDLLY
jgi:hypothetical protein